MYTYVLDRRRLPQPTVEEFQMATTAIGLNARLSGLSIQQQQQQLLAGGSPKRNQLSNPLTSESRAHASYSPNAHLIHPQNTPISLAGSRISTSAPISSSSFAYRTAQAAEHLQCRPFSPVSFFNFC